MNEERQYPRKSISIRQSSVNMLDSFCDEHKVSRTGLIEELATALIMRETRFFTIKRCDIKALADLHPSADNTWRVMCEKVTRLIIEFDMDSSDNISIAFYDACYQEGVTKKQVNKVLCGLVLELKDKGELD